MSKNEKIAIIGDGGWGTAMAVLLAASGKKPVIWGHDAAYLEEMRRTRENSRFLPGPAIPEAVAFEADPGRALEGAGMVVTAVPSKFLRPVLERIAPYFDPELIVVSLTKGLDADNLERPSQVVRARLRARHVVALSGPSHAEEVARFLPASVVAASEELEMARRVQQFISTSRFRIYASGDIVGVEVAGAVKNIIALAAGIARGLQLGDNALAALTTRGLVEMTRLGTAMGGQATTFSGLAGMGDLITTCCSTHSRNRRVGEMLAAGKSLDEILAGISGVPESVVTTSLVLALARKLGIDMPITREVAAVLWEGKKPEAALHDLMNRARKDEY